MRLKAWAHALKRVLNYRLLLATPCTSGSRRGNVSLRAKARVRLVGIMVLSAGARVRAAAIGQDDPLPPSDRVIHTATDTLYREQRPRLLRFLRHRTPSQNAGDVVQQVFERYFGLDDDRRAAIASPAGYLRRIAANLASDQARSDLRQANGMHVPVEEVDLVAPDQVAALEARDTLRHLEQALLRLKPRTREIFLAHRIDGYSYVQISARTGLSVKGVEKHMSRAIAHVDRVLSSR